MTSDELRDAIIGAHARQDVKRLSEILNAHDQQIRRDCLSWNKVPVPLRNDRARVNQFIQALGWLAETLKSSGDPRLYDLLVGTEKSNPLVRWDSLLKEAQELGDALEYDLAIHKLQDMLIDTSELKGPAMERYVPLTHGQLGHTCFHCGRIELAKGHYETALRLCRAYEDVEGIRVYNEALYEVHRYLGQPDVAAGYVGQAAAACERLGAAEDAQRLRRQATIVRDGEPLVRVVTVIGERQCELDDVQSAELRDQRVRFHFVRNRATLRKANILTKR